MNRRITSFQEINQRLAESRIKLRSTGEREEANERFFLRLQQLLELIGPIESATSDGDFSLQRDAAGCSASITLTTRTVWHESVVSLVQQCLREHPTQKHVYIDSALDLEQPIYLAVFSGHALGHAENPEWLTPFGFQ